MALYAEKLSLWEIAHRWYGEDPDKTRTAAELPLVVKDMLRNLCGAIWREELISMLYRSNEARTGAHLPGTRVSEFEDELSACCQGGAIDPEFLRFLKVDRAYLEIWCKEKEVVFPEFWKCPYVYEREAVGAEGDIARTVESDSPSTPMVSTAGTADNVQLDMPADDLSGNKSAQHRNAAFVRYEPLSELKRKFVSFRLHGRAPSDKEAARRFLKTLSVEDQDVLGRDPVRTLTEAMTAFRNGKSMQWLVGFDPAAPTR